MYWIRWFFFLHFSWYPTAPLFWFGLRVCFIREKIYNGSPTSEARALGARGHVTLAVIVSAEGHGLAVIADEEGEGTVPARRIDIARALGARGTPHRIA